MPARFKSKPDDLRLAFDEAADPVERSSAITRLRFDGFFEISTLLVKLIGHKSFLLRRDAIVTLVGFWLKPEYLNEAIKSLHEDKDEIVRSGAAFALAEFAVKTRANKELIKDALLKQLKQEKQSSVQEECYKSLLKIIAPEKVSSSAATQFNRQRDVDWNLLSLHNTADKKTFSALE